jgi:UDP-N-acetylmuramate dehydrogenase
MEPWQKKRLVSLLTAPVLWDCRLAPYTTFAIGGPATALARVESPIELRPLLAFFAAEGLPWRIIGRGSNLLVRDEGFPGVVLLLGKGFQGVSLLTRGEERCTLLVGAATALSVLARQVARLGLAGLAFASGIPGTVGGAVVMNAGAWGGDIGSLTESVTLVTADGERQLTAAAGELAFAYRCWPGFAPFQGRAVVTAVRLSLCPGDPRELAGEGRRLQQKRLASQPVAHNSAGSFFRNPPGDSAGRLIEASGLKGYRVGGAMVSERHGNFLVNTGGATASDVLLLMAIVQERVRADSGIQLEPEVHLL